MCSAAIFRAYFRLRLTSGLVAEESAVLRTLTELSLQEKVSPRPSAIRKSLCCKEVSALHQIFGLSIL